MFKVGRGKICPLFLMATDGEYIGSAILGNFASEIWKHLWMLIAVRFRTGRVAYLLNCSTAV